MAARTASPPVASARKLSKLDPIYLSQTHPVPDKRLTGCERPAVFLMFRRAELFGWGFSRQRARLSFSAGLVSFHPNAVPD
jgi:hypothetical protein